MSKLPAAIFRGAGPRTPQTYEGQAVDSSWGILQPAVALDEALRKWGTGAWEEAASAFGPDVTAAKPSGDALARARVAAQRATAAAVPGGGPAPMALTAPRPAATGPSSSVFTGEGADQGAGTTRAGGAGPAKSGEELRAALDALAKVDMGRPAGTGYIRVGPGQAIPEGEMVLSNEMTADGTNGTDGTNAATGTRRIFGRVPGGNWEEATVPGGTVTGAPVEGPARTIGTYNAGIVPAQFQVASDEAMRQADQVKEIRNRLEQDRQMATADLARHQKEHEAFRFKWGVSAADLDTPGTAGTLSLPGGTARQRAEVAAWVERNDAARVEERRGLEARARKVDEGYGQAQRGYDSLLRHSDEVLRQGRAAGAAQYEATVAAARHGTTVRNEQSARDRIAQERMDLSERSADLAQTREERIAQENADRADLAQTREERMARENADRAARQDRVDAVNHAKALLDMADKDLLRFSEDYTKESKTGWTPDLGAPDPRNPEIEDKVKNTWKKNPALFKQDVAAWARYSQLKALAEQNDKRYQDLVLGWTPGGGGESGRGGPGGRGGQGGQIATYSKFPDIEAEAIKYSAMGIPDEQIRSTVKKLEVKRVVK